MLASLVRHCLVALYPSVDGMPGYGETDPDGAQVRRMLSDMPGLMWLGVVGSALMFVATPLITVGWPVPSLLLPGPVLDLHAQRAASHWIYTLRQGVFLLKMTACLHWAAVPEVRAQWALPPYPADPDTWRTS